MRVVRAISLLSLLVAAACSEPPPSEPPDAGTPDAGKVGLCELTAPTECPTPAPVYGDVSPIFERRCVWCHYGREGGPWPLTDYGHVADWKDDIRSDVLTCNMPPPDADGGEVMTDEERLAILTWIRCGMPR